MGHPTRRRGQTPTVVPCKVDAYTGRGASRAQHALRPGELELREGQPAELVPRLPELREWFAITVLPMLSITVPSPGAFVCLRPMGVAREVEIARAADGAVWTKKHSCGFDELFERELRDCARGQAGWVVRGAELSAASGLPPPANASRHSANDEFVAT